MGPFSSHHLITYYIRSFHTINSPYEPISLAEIIIKVFAFLSSSAVGDWRRGESLCLCAQLNILRKLFVVWWKCCVLEMIRGYFVRALESFSFSAVYFWIRGFRPQCQPDRTGGCGVSRERRWLEKLIYGYGWAWGCHEIFSPRLEGKTSTHGDEFKVAKKKSFSLTFQ